MLNPYTTLIRKPGRKRSLKIPIHKWVLKQQDVSVWIKFRHPK
jgi:hypothetical protein